MPRLPLLALLITPAVAGCAANIALPWLADPADDPAYIAARAEQVRKARLDHYLQDAQRREYAIARAVRPPAQCTEWARRPVTLTLRTRDGRVQVPGTALVCIRTVQPPPRPVPSLADPHRWDLGAHPEAPNVGDL